ncbi:hypothetical protein A7X12_08345 [Sphingomonas sp. TDK1]|nr:hypothetical protein A7X12_08345 [Sphingomonas sp. TDK1]
MDLRVSESFTTQATAAAANYPGNGSSASSPGTATLTVQYDAPTGSYTIVRPGLTTQFGPAQGDAAASNVVFAAYHRQDGSTTETLRLTNPGKQGALNQEYVGAGFWRILDTAGGVEQNRFGSFTYGIRTAAADMPASGTASFGIGLLAMGATKDAVVDIYGTGTFQVDFGAHTFTLQGATTTRLLNQLGSKGPPYLVAGTFRGDGLVAASANAFTGGIKLDGSGTYTSTLQGFFYGPDLAEVGATFSGTYGNLGLSGSLIGRRGNTAPELETLARLFGPAEVQETTRQLLYNANATGTTFRDAALDVGTYSSLILDPGSGGIDMRIYKFGTTDRVAAESDARFTTYRLGGMVLRTIKLYNAGGTNSELALSYASFFSMTNAAVGEDRRWDSFTVFGLNTAGGNVPKTGHGLFDGRVYGSAVGAGATADRFSMEGTATMDFDFAASSFTGAMTTAATNLRTGVTSQLGSYTFDNGKIAPLSLSFNAEIAGTPGSSGALNGSFYGPAAQELGATFGLITPGAGTVLTGVGAIVGKRR